MQTHARSGADRPPNGRVDDPVTAPEVTLEGGLPLRHLVDALDAFMWRADPLTLRISFVTRSVVALVGHPVSRWVGGPERWASLIDPEDRDRVIARLRACAMEGSDDAIDFRVKAADGSERWLRHVVRVVSDNDGDPELWGVTTDVTAEKRAEEVLRTTNEKVRSLSAQAEEFRHRALHDSLSGLPNRVLLHDRLQVALRSSQRTGEPCAVMLMDLDGFKEINDTEGHAVGDQVIRQVALRLRLALRRADTAARYGGDEFAAVLPGADEHAAIRAARRIAEALHPGLEVCDKNIDVGASIGIAVFPQDGSDARSLLARADEAMYRAKAAGGGYHVSTTEPARAGKRPRRRGDRRRGVTRAASRWTKHLLLGAAASLLAFSGGIGLVARSDGSAREAAAGLDAAAVVLRDAPQNAGAVAEVVDRAERALARMSLNELAGKDLLRALDRLEETLASVGDSLSEPLRDRIRRLIASIRSAETVARLSPPQSRQSPPAVQEIAPATRGEPEPQGGVPNSVPKKQVTPPPRTLNR